MTHSMISYLILFVSYQSNISIKKKIVIKIKPQFCTSITLDRQNELMLKKLLFICSQ